MSTYAIGDIQGCYDELVALLERIAYEPRRDQLWLVGDLVNRGPRSLDVLRWAIEQGDSVVSVLGNHDLHLLVRAAGVVRPKKTDTLDDVLSAPDRDELLHWLRHRPFAHRRGGWLLVHAGLVPSWDVPTALAQATETEGDMRGDHWRELLGAWRHAPHAAWGTAWRRDLDHEERFAFALNAFTRLRLCSVDGRMAMGFKGPPERAPAGLRPWFDLRDDPPDLTIIFGHWAALGRCIRPGLAGLDSGCIWGRALTAMRLDDGRIFEQPSLARGSAGRLKP